MNLLSTAEISDFSNDYSHFYDTMSSFHNITVIKKPQEQILDINNNNAYYGYGQDNSNPQNITYVPISGSFRCIVVGSTKSATKDKPLEILPAWIMSADSIIKVETDAKDFIENGLINERIILDSETFVKISASARKIYGNLIYWYFGLSQTL